MTLKVSEAVIGNQFTAKVNTISIGFISQPFTECRELVHNLVKQISKDFPDKFAEVIRSSAEAAEFVQTLSLQ